MTSKSEIWKSHPDIEGIEVSTLGRVRTLDRLESSEERTQFTKGRVLKQSENSNGYLQVCFRMNNKSFYKRVHRLVAQTFLPNPDGFQMVNHRDCNRKNNNVENLEWCTASYNSKYREKFGNALSKPVLAINLSTLEVSYFRSQSEASRKLGVFQPQINAVIKGKRKQTGGFWFTNADDNADDAINRKLYEIGKTGLNIR